MNTVNKNFGNFLPNSISKNVWRASVVLIIGFFLTFIVVIYTYRNVEQQTKGEYIEVCYGIKNKILSRLHTHALLLRSGSAFLTGSDTVTRSEWKRFNERQQIQKNLPGIQGVGFSLIIPKIKLQQHIQKVRNEGFPDYIVKPEGDRDIYTSIIYLEPFSDRNLRAFGYDMFSEPIRRKAMELSCDSDVAMLSGKIVLVQETNADVQAGTLMYVPVYKNDMPVSTVEQRRAAIIGWVYSPYRMNDLMNGILCHNELNQQNKIHIQIYDESISDSSLLYDSQSKDSLTHIDSHNRMQILSFAFNNKKWILYFTQSTEQFSYFQSKVLIVLICGILISFLMFLLTLSLFNVRHRALQIAQKLTKKLSESEQNLRQSQDFLNNIIEHSPNAMWVSDEHGTLIRLNKACREKLNLQDSEVVGIYNIFKDNIIESQGLMPLVKDVFEKGVDTRFITTYNTADVKGISLQNTIKLVLDISISPVLNSNGKVTNAIIQHIDITKLKNTEQELIESESRFKNMFAMHHSIMLLIEPESGQIIDANKTASEFYGYTISDLCKMSINDINILNPEETKEIRKKIAEEKQNHFIFSHKLANGELRTIDTYSSQIEYEGRKIIFAIMHDITELKKIEHALIDSEEKLKEAQSLSKIGHWELDLHLNKLTWSDEIYRIFACNPIDFGATYEAFLGFIHPDDREYVNNSYTSHLKTKQPYNIIHRIVLSNGEIKYVNECCKSDFDKNNNAIRSIGTIADITISKLSELALKESEKKFKEIINQINDGIIVFNAEGLVLIWNNGATKILGIEAADTIGRLVTEIPCHFVSPDMQDKLIQENLLKTIISLQTPEVFNNKIDLEIFYQNTNVIKTIQSNIFLIELDNQKLFCSVFRDITESKNYEKKLSQLNTDKDRFLSILAHDLRNPFFAILGFTDLLLKNISKHDFEKIESYAVQINQSTHKVYNLLEDLLLWARVQSDKLSFEPQSFNLRKLFEEIFEISNLNAVSKDISINYLIADDINVFADVNMIKTVLRNLLSNAIKFTNYRGKIEISTQHDQTKEIIAISDNGIGMTKDTLHKLFDITQTYSITGTGNEIGTGLGLFLCKEFIEKNGGSIWVESELGKGSSFYFTLNTIVF